MESDHSAPETALYVSNQSDFVSSSYSLEDSDKEVVAQKQATGDVEGDNNEGRNGGVNGGSENDGFVSGDEEFETPSQRPISAYLDEKSAEGRVVHANFVNSEEFFTPKTGGAVDKVSLDGDEHGVGVGVGDSGGGILGSENVEEGGGGDVNLAGEVTAEKFEAEAARMEYKEDAVRTESIKESGFGDIHEKFAEDFGGIDNKNFESGKEKESVHSVIGGGMVTEQNGVEFHNLKDEDVDKEQNKELLHDTQPAISVEADSSAQVDTAGDSVVNNFQVDLLLSGVAVVGDKEDIDESEIKGMEAPASVHLDNEFNPIERDVEEPLDKFPTSDAKSDQNVDNAVDNITKHADEGMNIALQEKGDNLDSESHRVDTEVKAPASGISLNNGFGPIEQDADEPFDTFETSEAKPDQNVDNVVEDDTKYADEGMQIPPQEKSDSLDSENQLVEAEVKAPASGVSLDNGFDPIERSVEELFDKFATSEAKSYQNVDNEVEDDTKQADEGMYIMPQEKSDSLDSENQRTDTEMKDSAGGTGLDNGFDPIDRDAEGPFDKFATSEANSDQNIDNVVNDDRKNVDEGMHIAPQEKGDNLDSESHRVDTEVKALQDDINVEAHADEGDDSRVEASVDTEVKGLQDDTNAEAHANEGETGGHIKATGESLVSECVDPNSSWRRGIVQGEDDEKVHHPRGEIDASVSDGESEGMIFGSSEADQRFLEELEQHSGAESSQEPSQRIDGQIVTDSDEEVDTDEEGDRKELFDSAALAALLKAATGAGQDGGNITITSQDGSRLFSVERPAGLGPSLQSVKPAARANRVGLFTPSNPRSGADSDSNLSEEEKKKLEKLQQIRIKFLRLVQRLGFTPEESIAAQILYRLAILAGKQISDLFSLEDAKRSASHLESAARDDLEFSLNILVIGKSGVGKSATINSIFGETKTSINAYGPATTAVTEIVGTIDGVKIRVFDTPGLKSSAVEQSFNRKVLSMVKKFTKKSPPDIVLYVDRLDIQTRNLNDLPLLKSITNALGPSIWQSVIITLTHAASAPPDGPSGSPLGYDVFVAQRSHIVQQAIGQAAGDLRLMNPTVMCPVSLVENHRSCRKNRDGEKVLPNGQSWRPQLLLLSYSMKILSEAGNTSKTQDKFDQRRLFGFRVRSPPLPYLLSWLLQSRSHPKLPSDQGGDNGDSDIEMADLSDSDLDEDEDEYDQLPPFKPLRKSQIAKLSGEQRKAYFEEYDYRVKLLRKKQWREELKRMREMKKKGKSNVNDYMEEDDQENGSPAAVPVPLPDMVLPPSFDSDNPAYRYRFLEPTSQLLTRPVLDTHGWDHDCGYDGVNLEHSLAIINQFPAAVSVQVTKDKNDFTIHLDSSVAKKHGENGSTMAGFDIQNIGKQLAYIVRGETKFKNFKRNKTAAGVSVTFLGENVSTGLKVEDQIALGKRFVLVGSTGTVKSQGDSAYGANVEVRLREADFPIGQDQSSLGLSLVKWRGDLALGANFQSQFSLGRSYKMAVRAGLNNKLSGQITVRTSSSDQLQIALVAILPVAKALYKKFWPGASENYAIY